MASHQADLAKSPFARRSTYNGAWR
jgi:hypothetical protein